jgi:hypothetical protein
VYKQQAFNLDIFGQQVEIKLVGLIAIHILLGLLSTANTTVAFIHAIIVLLVGFFACISAKRHLVTVLYICAYIVGAELFWRMNLASIPWEIGKYSIAVFLTISFLVCNFKIIPFRFVSYFILLLPSAIFTFLSRDWIDARELVSFNLSAHLLLVVAGITFSNITINHRQIAQMLWAFILPIVSIATRTFIIVLSTPNILWKNESNFTASGGWGANQIASILGLGAVITVYLLFTSENSFLKTLLLVLLVWFAAQSVITFSRGGIFTAIITGVPMLFQAYRAKKMNFKVLGYLILFGVIFYWVIWPYLEQLSGGMIDQRFTTLNTSNREFIAQNEFDIFLENPLLGAGVGETRSRHFDDLETASHTEYTRILAEHGVLGLTAMVLIGHALVINYFRRKDIITKSFITMCLVWSLLTMAHSGTRYAGITFLIALSFINIADESKLIIPSSLD